MDLNNSLTNLDWLIQLPQQRRLPELKPNLIVTTNNKFIKPLIPTPMTPFAPDMHTNMPNSMSSSSLVEAPTTLDADARPNVSYSNLIASAIRSSREGRMTLGEIYDWVCEHYPYYKTAGSSWKNSIRHNLSFNRMFVKVPREAHFPGKGAYWTINHHSAKEKGEKKAASKKRRKPTQIQVETNNHLTLSQIQSPPISAQTAADNVSLPSLSFTNFLQYSLQHTSSNHHLPQRSEIYSVDPPPFDDYPNANSHRNSNEFLTASDMQAFSNESLNLDSKSHFPIKSSNQVSIGSLIMDEDDFDYSRLI